MGTTPGLMTIEQYLHTAYRPDVDFVHGEIQERNPGDFEHGHMQGHLSTFARGVLSPEDRCPARSVFWRTIEPWKSKIPGRSIPSEEWLTL